jgi:hypothetical protein
MDDADEAERELHEAELARRDLERVAIVAEQAGLPGHEGTGVEAFREVELAAKG